ncbi:TonB-dependent receptor [Rhodoferax sp.]|uniref:TonB-dependent receptor domain-containing protein n=1 Tax=Rhodoferax sp. TaxID=50421 RepID=UPI0025E8C67B|nr:TonB-dependent receptor [Rhodoferax sp.]MCM2295216.1 TonB-dependent receptor [Rhodoferax sp.]
MKTFVFSKRGCTPVRLCASVLAVFAAFPVLAQGQASGTLGEVVVTATRTEQPLTDVLADVSIIDRDVIERSGAAGVADVLSRLPGMTITQTGGAATPTSVYIRGAESRFTAVFIDGVRVDSQSTGGAPWESIPLLQVERIEVLRGPAAAIYGSDAVAGVVQIFTKQGVKGFAPSVSVGLGSNNTREVNASLLGGSDDVDYALGLGHSETDGFNAKTSGNPDRDGARSRSFSGRLGWKLQPGHKLELTALDNDLKAGYDANPVSAADDQTQRHLQTIGLNWTARWSDVWSSRLSLTRGTDHYETTPSVYVTDTQVNSYLLHNEWRVGPGLLTAALERREDELENASTSPKTTQRSQNAVALGYGFRSGAHTLQVNARQDDDSEFGDKSTGSLAYGYELVPGLRVMVSKSTGFRVPTLFQRFSIYGVPALKAETSDNTEAAIRWQAGYNQAALVVYRNDVENLINYVTGPGSCVNGTGTYAGCYGNTGQARLSGTTLTGSTQWAGINWGASIDWMNPINTQTDKVLARRARKQATLTVDMPMREWRLGAEWQYAGERFDNASNSIRLAPYSLLNLTATRSIARDWQLLARVSNLADKDYVLANGYATAGRTVYLGLTWSPK